MTAPEPADPIIMHTRAAAEEVRTANRTAYQAPRNATALYDRTGALNDLLVKIEQLVQFLASGVATLSAAPPPGFFAQDEGDPEELVNDATHQLTQALIKITASRRHVNVAWAILSQLGQKP